MRFEETYSNWTEKRLSQEEAARLIGVCTRTFRVYVYRYEEAGLDSLLNKRLIQPSFRRASVGDVFALTEQPALEETPDICLKPGSERMYKTFSPAWQIIQRTTRTVS